MSGTVTPFTPSLGMPQRFSATLMGPTVNVTSTSTAFTVTVPWNVYGQRFYVLIQDASGNTVLNKPLVASPPGYDINLVAGYFSGSSLVFEEATGSFVVTQYPQIVASVISQPAYISPVVNTPGSQPTNDSGYILYAYWNNSGASPIVSMTCSFIVPPAPVNQGSQTINLFPALQPAGGSAYILQPLLIWTTDTPGGVTPPDGVWSISSWYVSGATVNAVSKFVVVQPGTVLTAVIICTGSNQYQMYFTGYPDTVLSVTTGSPATTALVALECYHLATCNSYPSGSTAFSGIQVNVGTAGTFGSPAPNFALTPVTKFSDCGLSISIDSSSQVTLTY
jgi:hypothetical protein